MKKKRLFGIALALIFVLQLMLPMSWASADTTGTWDHVIEERGGSIKIMDGETELDPSDGLFDNIPLNAEIELTYRFFMPDSDGDGASHVYKAGDTYTVQLPPELVAIAEFPEGPQALSRGADIYAYMTINADGLVTVIFEPYVETNFNIDGELRLNGTFTASEIGESTPEVSFTFASENYTFKFEQPEVPDVNVGVSKSGVYDEVANEIEWTIIVTPDAEQTVPGVSVVD